MSKPDLTQLSDEDLRAALFDALVERLATKAREDPSISVVNRMHTVFVVSRWGNLLTLSEGLGLWLLRGDLKWKDRLARPRIFTVRRATIQSRLTIMPDRIEGTPDEILDQIVLMFLESTASAAERQPATAEVTPLTGAEESRPTARAPQQMPKMPDAIHEQPATSAGATQENRAAPPQSGRESRRAAGEGSRTTPGKVTEEGQQAPRVPDTLSAPEAVRARRLLIPKTTTPVSRTYQLLFQTARREFDQARATTTADRKYFLIGAGVFVALTAEAFLNDLGSRMIPSWSQLQRLDPREKAEVLSIELFNDKVDWSTRPFQSVAAALGFRRALAYAHAETLSFDPVRTADPMEAQVPRTRRTDWQEHCDVATIYRWINDVHLVIELFSRAHDPTMIEQSPARSARRSGTDRARRRRPDDSR